jgi:hypothetical protein
VSAVKWPQAAKLKQAKLIPAKLKPAKLKRAKLWRTPRGFVRRISKKFRHAVYESTFWEISK